jgi:Asp-tRNA(Asn)/Glu-tRNA(Gln) amidotransferase B subunit
METHSPKGEDRSFATEMIIRDIRDLIYDVQSYEANTSEYRKDAIRVFTNVVEGEEGTLKSYDTVSNGLVDAIDALERAKERFGVVEEMLLKLIDGIERESLSSRVQAR